jgi:hypothetical protein
MSLGEIISSHDLLQSREPDWRGITAKNAQSTGKEPSLLGIFRTGYFCVPPNPELVALRDLIDDRLYKIPNCQDINGNGIQLSLWEPPIDSSALVKAQTAGFNASVFLSEKAGAVTGLRFQYLPGKAFELCAELKSMGEQFLTIKEKKDAEALNTLRQSQELVINNIMLDIKRLERDEAMKSLQALDETRRSHKTKLSFYLRLI